MRRAALGFKGHIGWAAVVAIADGAHEVILKRRLDMATDFATGAVYHAGQELPFAKAEALIHSSEAKFEATARKEIGAIARELDALDWEVVASGVVGGNPRPLPPLESILRSHPLIHAAEADLYRRVVARASEACRIHALLIPAKEIESRAARAIGVSTGGLAKLIAAIGKASGRPWTVDQKESALAALAALG